MHPDPVPPPETPPPETLPLLADPLPVLAETDAWIVVAKPPRLRVHRNVRARYADAVLQRVRDQVGQWVYPIHRLDYQASGCLILAKERSWAGPLHAALTAPETVKTYLAFVRGWFPHDEPVQITQPMKDDNGILKDAESLVECLGRCHDPRSSLLRVRPRTGRYHQVRRHVRDLHHPCIGDSNHGDSKVNRYWRETWGNRRLGLHALSLSLILPDKTPLTVVCPLFADQHALYQRLPWWSEACSAEPALELPPLPLIPTYDRYPGGVKPTAPADPPAPST